MSVDFVPQPAGQIQFNPNRPLFRVFLDHTPDEDILQWAAENNRIVITHDINSMRGLADGRARAGLPMPGAIIVLDHVSYGVAIEFIAYVDSGQYGDMEGRTVFAKRLS